MGLVRSVVQSERLKQVHEEAEFDYETFVKPVVRSVIKTHRRKGHLEEAETGYEDFIKDRLYGDWLDSQKQKSEKKADQNLRARMKAEQRPQGKKRADQEFRRKTKKERQFDDQWKTFSRVVHIMSGLEHDGDVFGGLHQVIFGRSYDRSWKPPAMLLTQLAVAKRPARQRVLKDRIRIPVEKCVKQRERRYDISPLAIREKSLPDSEKRHVEDHDSGYGSSPPHVEVASLPAGADDLLATSDNKEAKRGGYKHYFRRGRLVRAIKFLHRHGYCRILRGFAGEGIKMAVKRGRQVRRRNQRGGGLGRLW